jgi:hypothetical protein
MFKKSIVAFLFCLTSTIANAQNEGSAYSSQKPVLCDNTKKVLKTLMEKYGEVPVWTAKDASDDSRYLLLVNSKTTSWTLIQFTPEHACIIGLGEQSNLASQDKSTI